MDFGRFNQAEQAEINAIIEQKTMSEFLKQFTTVVDVCFKRCAQDFQTKAVTRRENECVNRCADVFIQHTKRVEQVFSELYHNNNTQ
ncbi:hypothetical protein K501DRAFT_248364 [Backusella circina FSU 941]|nr:hypothetical protein K501DRAFT_248364 [Backusella circina FSU 941]